METITMQQLMSNIGYTFHNPRLLYQALTHPSMGENDNQRLEFLGDAVLEFILSNDLYLAHPKDQEGALTHQRALLSCEAALSQVAQGLGIGQALMMDRGEEMTGGREKPSVLCDAMEAVLAAVYLDGGLEPVQQIVRRFWPKPEDVHRPLQDSKSALQELLQKDGSEAPTYAIVEQHGPDHARTFVAVVTRYGKVLAKGSGHSKKQAEQAAALAALEAMGER